MLSLDVQSNVDITSTHTRAHTRIHVQHGRPTHTRTHTYPHTPIPIRRHTRTHAPIPIRTRVLSVARARTHRPAVHIHAHVDRRANWLLSSLRLVRCELFVVLPLQVSARAALVRRSDDDRSAYRNVNFSPNGVLVDLPTGCCGYYVIRQCCRRWPV